MLSKLYQQQEADLRPETSSMSLLSVLHGLGSNPQLGHHGLTKPVFVQFHLRPEQVLI